MFTLLLQKKILCYKTLLELKLDPRISYMFCLKNKIETFVRI
jgi:hypothetical protein